MNDFGVEELVILTRESPECWHGFRFCGSPSAVERLLKAYLYGRSQFRLVLALRGKVDPNLYRVEITELKKVLR